MRKGILLTSVWLLIGISCAIGRSAATKRVGAPILLEDFKLVGQLSGDQAVFVLTATAQVANPGGGSLELLQGTVALTEIGKHTKWKIRAEQNRFVLDFERGGRFPIEIKFNAALHERDGWKAVDFHVAPSAL